MYITSVTAEEKSILLCDLDGNYLHTILRIPIVDKASDQDNKTTPSPPLVNDDGDVTDHELSTTIVSHIQSLAVDPIKAKLYFLHFEDANFIVEECNMDGSSRRVLVTQKKNSTIGHHGRKCGL